MIPETLRDELDHKARMIELCIHLDGLLFLPADS